MEKVCFVWQLDAGLTFI